MQRAQALGIARWRVAVTGPAIVLRHPAVRWLAGLAFLVLLPVAQRSPVAFRFLVGEDLLYEWLQVACLAATAALVLRAARRVDLGRRRLVLAGVGVVALVVVGEELAWGTRLLNLSVEPVQSINVQHDATLHNLGFGLKASFLGMAAVSTVLALWQAGKGNWELACWFTVPAVYGAVRVLAGAGSYEAAKMSEVAELAFAVAAVRVAWAETRLLPA